jgi:hypothetical protein
MKKIYRWYAKEKMMSEVQLYSFAYACVMLL